MPRQQNLNISSADLNAIGRYITANFETIIAEWMALSRDEHPEASDEQRQALRNSLPDFLQELGKNLMEGDPEIPRGSTVEHGLQRWEIGWDVDSLIRDFQILRRVLASRFMQSLDLENHAIVEFGSLLDEAVALSVTAYIEHRELELSKRNEMLRLKNYDLKRFAHMVAHEVRNPLGIMTLAISKLKSNLADSTDAAQSFALIEEGRQTILQVLDNLVRYADMEFSHTAETREVDLNSVYDKSISHLKFALESSDAELSTDDLPTVVGDEVALRTLFQNLIENAVKYAGNQPPRIKITSKSTASHHTIRFRDHGIGIAPEDHGRVFQFLIRINDDHSEIDGTGVGLAICRRVAEQHGGTLTVESELGQGAEFILSLPRK